jgi:hypothetical protein
MSQLIDLVSGGYKVLSSEKIIPASELIPFGILQTFLLQKKDYENNLNYTKSELEKLAKTYIDRMGMKYGQVFIEEEQIKIQLYAINNPRGIN